MPKASPALDPEKALTHLLEECRMVLPGIQALFGFQLIAVFNAPFKELLSGGEQIAHFGAMFIVAVAVGLVMAPAAFHRISEPGSVTKSFLTLASRLLGTRMGFLVIGIGLDVYLIGRIIFGSTMWALSFAISIEFILGGLWFVAPLFRARRHSPQS